MAFVTALLANDFVVIAVFPSGEIPSNVVRVAISACPVKSATKAVAFASVAFAPVPANASISSAIRPIVAPVVQPVPKDNAATMALASHPARLQHLRSVQAVATIHREAPYIAVAAANAVSQAKTASVDNATARRDGSLVALGASILPTTTNTAEDATKDALPDRSAPMAAVSHLAPKAHPATVLAVALIPLTTAHTADVVANCAKAVPAASKACASALEDKPYAMVDVKIYSPIQPTAACVGAPANKARCALAASASHPAPQVRQRSALAVASMSKMTPTTAAAAASDALAA